MCLKFSLSEVVESLYERRGRQSECDSKDTKVTWMSRTLDLVKLGSKVQDGILIGREWNVSHIGLD
eukprot:5502254-Pyramimonas_sp.AAC.1